MSADVLGVIVLVCLGYLLLTNLTYVALVAVDAVRLPSLDAVLELLGRETVLARLSHHLNND